MRAEQSVINSFNKSNLPFVILKGSSFARYYPDPTSRVRGDIDILVNESDFEAASKILIDSGFISEDFPQNPNWRHIKYYKNNTLIELHRFFWLRDRQAVFFNVAKREIIDGIPCFPPVENGISMLLHMRWHMGRIGLRHYMDWIMYVRNVCDDAF